MYIVAWPVLVSGLVVIYICMDEREEYVESWKKVAIFKSICNALLHSGVLDSLPSINVPY